MPSRPGERGRQSWTDKKGVTIKKWTREEDFCLLAALEAVPTSNRGKRNWPATCAWMTAEGHRRTTQQARNRLQRLQYGVKLGGRNFCTVCGRRRRGHICEGPLSVREVFDHARERAAALLAEEAAEVDIAELHELVEDDASETREGRPKEA